MQFIRPFLLLIASFSFGLGITLPLVRFEKFYFFSETPSLVEIIVGLWQANDLALAAVVGVFSIVLPATKLAVTFQSVFTGKQLAAWASLIAKWSMMDVLLVAILVFAAKTSGLATAIAQPGIWFFALSAATAALATFKGLSR